MRVSEIFQSMDGEVSRWGQGKLSTFIRLSGCNLNCSFCDTPQKAVVEEMSLKQVIERVKKLSCPKVTLTGGEPLVQADEVYPLLTWFLTFGYKVSVETNGSIAPDRRWLQDPDLSWIFDYKLEFPEQMELEMMGHILSSHHWVKIVVKDERDYREAVRIKEVIRGEGSKVSIAFSPAFDLQYNYVVSPSMLVDWLIRDKQWDVVVNVQIHKLISVR